MIVVSDTSPLRYLILIDAVELLPKLFGLVLIPPAVALELRKSQTPELVRKWMTTPPTWLEFVTPTANDPTLDVDYGEREAILLAREKGAPLLIDDAKGRSAAEERKIQTLGTLAVLVAGAEQNFIDLPTVLARLTQTTNFRTPTALVLTLLQRDAARKEEERRR